MKRIGCIVLVLIFHAMFLPIFSACEAMPDYADWKIDGSKNIIFPRRSYVLEREKDEAEYREMYVMRYDGDDVMLKNKGFRFIVQRENQFELYYIKDEFLIFDDGNIPEDELADFKQANLWGTPNSYELATEHTYWGYREDYNDRGVFYDNSYPSEENLALFEDFAKEKFDVSGTCNNTVQDKYDRTLGGILVPTGDGFELYAVCVQGMMKSGKCYYDPQTAIGKIDLDNYLVELESFQRLNHWNEETTLKEIKKLDSWR